MASRSQKPSEHAGQDRRARARYQAFGEHLSRDALAAPAPSASRRLISRSRADARANNRFARLAQAMSSTSPTNATRTRSGWLNSSRRSFTPRSPAVNRKCGRSLPGPCLEQGANDVAEGQVETRSGICRSSTPGGKTPHDEHPPVIRIVEQGRALAPSDREDHRLLAHRYEQDRAAGQASGR